MSSKDMAGLKLISKVRPDTVKMAESCRLGQGEACGGYAGFINSLYARVHITKRVNQLMNGKMVVTGALA